jgi:hypothetical protein
MQQNVSMTTTTAMLDSHHRVDIAHSTFWVRGDGETVSPFTAITAAEVRSDAYRPREAQALPRAGLPGLNKPLLRHLDREGTRLIAGQASSHCVRATTEHLVEHMSRRRPQDIVLLSDCMSPVAGFEVQQQEFFDAMRARGVRVARAAELL